MRNAYLELRSEIRIPQFETEWHLNKGIVKSARETPRERHGEATKGIRWMPRRLVPKKDVVGCDKPRGAANRL